MRAWFAIAAGVVVAACGSRTPLLVPPDASVSDVIAIDVVPPSDVQLGFDVTLLGDGGPLTCEQAAEQKGSAGCDYLVPTPSFYPNIAPPCFAVFVANDGIDPVLIQVDRGGISYDVTAFGRLSASDDPASWPPVPAAGLPPGEVAVLFVSQDPMSNNNGPLTCPITPALSQQYGSALPGSGTTSALTGRGTAWHIVTDHPVMAYDILPFGGAKSYLPSAELLLPTAAWGTNYFAIVPQHGTSTFPQWGQLVALENGTSVTVFPNVALPSGASVADAPANTQTTFTLSAGEYIQWQDSGEMSGTILQSNTPIGFFGGLTYDCYADSTSTGGGCDSAHQQMPPIDAFGSTYAVAPYTTRRSDGQPESIRYRFVGAAGGTALSYDPHVSSAPTQLGEGQIADFETASPFVVRAQDNSHPFYVGQVMTGCQVTSGSWDTSCVGDEEYVNVIPPAEYLRSYVFFTDLTYRSTNLVFTRTRGPNGFSDVTLDCLGAPVSGWTNIDTAGQYQFTNVWLTKAGEPQGACTNGPHFAKSDGQFTITVWGLDSYASYAYPAGANISPINALVVPPKAH